MTGAVEKEAPNCKSFVMHSFKEANKCVERHELLGETIENGLTGVLRRYKGSKECGLDAVDDFAELELYTVDVDIESDGSDY